MAPLGWLFSGMMKKCIRADLEDTKRHLEGGGQAVPAAGEAAG